MNRHTLRPGTGALRYCRVKFRVGQRLRINQRFDPENGALAADIEPIENKCSRPTRATAAGAASG